MDGKVKFGMGVGTENASAEPESIDAASNPMAAVPNALPLGLALGSGLAFGSDLDFASGLAFAVGFAFVCVGCCWAGAAFAACKKAQAPPRLHSPLMKSRHGGLCQCPHSLPRVHLPCR